MAFRKFDYKRPVYIVDGTRTPFLKARSKPGPFKHADLAIQSARALLNRMPFEPDAIDEVIYGSTMPASDEANISRVIALRLGCGDDVPAFTVHRNCASGMQSLDSAAQSISEGRSELILAGGVEAMSRAPVMLSDPMVEWLGAWGSARDLPARLKLLGKLRPAMFRPVIALLNGLRDPVVGMSMGQTAEQVAWRFGITREQMDAYAVQSHMRLDQAHQAGVFDREIVPMFDSRGKLYDFDEGVRPDSTIEKLARLKPAFDKPYGLVTAGNSSQITDGAASLILASEKAIEQYDLPVLARFTTTHWAALKPDEMGLGPAHAIVPLLRSRRLKLDSIDYWEINEAFAAQVLGVIEALADKKYAAEHLGIKTPIGRIPMDRLNIHGGGISLGHPVGASGARITLHLANILKQTGARRGVASLCIGGGQGGAVLIEREKQS